MQFKAGYIADSIAKIISCEKQNFKNENPANTEKLNQINGLLQYVTSFDVEFSGNNQNQKLDFKRLNPVLAILNNIITRGLPTRAPVILEELFEKVGLTRINEKIKAFELDYSELSELDIDYKTVFELLHIIEPGLEISRSNYGGNPGSNLEWEFLTRHEFLKQILESQRDFSTINPRLQGDRKVDFSFTSPYLYWNNEGRCSGNKGMIFEVDGPHHFLSEYKFYDQYRDNAANEENYETLRITTDEINSLNPDFERLIKKDVFNHHYTNYDRKSTQYLKKKYSLIFIPLAVARIQKTIIEILLRDEQSDKSLLSKDKIKLAIIERDFPCGGIAVKCLQDMFENINAILKEKDKLQLKIDLVIFNENKDWCYNDRLHYDATIQDTDYFNDNEFDIVIDHSILRRSNIYKETTFTGKENTIKIRSAHYADNSFGRARRTYCADLLHYEPLVDKQDDGSYKSKPELEKHINYFIQNIFRKKEFREGQLPIISRALQQLPVIGLLPTGGGKSLTFQLPALLQPGLCLIVDPIRSLMQDQVRVLNENWIDTCDYINSDCSLEEKQKKFVNVRYGEMQFLFVSPERFVMLDFRIIISFIDGGHFGLAFSYCVIDEVHCVSEWGHDFRTTYLSLGKNAQRFCKAKNENSVTLIGLTATASFDVLTDIERELKIEKEQIADAIVMIDNTIRPEIFFNVIETPDFTFTNIKNGQSIIKNDQSIKDNIGAKKQELLNHSISNLVSELKQIDENTVDASLQQHFKDFEIIVDNKKKESTREKINNTEINDKNSEITTIIFCPHTSGSLGVTELANKFPNHKEVFEKLNVADNLKGFFIGDLPNNFDENHRQFVRGNVQESFKRFINGDISYMVCTKAFGMGIDKKNIRAVYHINYSNSPESYIQEAGRAGRDSGKSLCTIIFDRSKFYKLRDSVLSIPNLTAQKRKDLRELIEVYSPRNNNFPDRIYPLSYCENPIVSNKSIDLITKINNLQLGAQLTDEIINKHIYEISKDRNVYDFFHNENFKGIETENYQIDKILSSDFDLNNGRSLEEIFLSQDETTFKIPVKPVNENLVNKILSDFHLSPLSFNVVNNSVQTVSANTFLATILSQSSSFKDFIYRIDENWQALNILKQPQYQQNKQHYKKAYYSEIKNNDVSRIIYRLMCIGLISDYTLDYNTQIFSCTISKITKRDCIEHTRLFLKKYIAAERTENIIDELEESVKSLSTFGTIKKAIRKIIEFTYSEVVNKRKRAVDDIHKFINDSIEKANQKVNNHSFKNYWYNHYFKEELYYYFNAKYARPGYKINGQNCSLLDDTDKGRVSDWGVFEKYVTILNDQQSFISECKMMRGSCKRIWRFLSVTDLPNEWVLKMLYSFATFGLNNDYYSEDAENNFCESFKIFYYSDTCQKSYNVFSDKIEEYEKLLVQSVNNNNHSSFFKLAKQALMIEFHTEYIKKPLKKYNELFAILSK